jgi:hypothetical protein
MSGLGQKQHRAAAALSIFVPFVNSSGTAGSVKLTDSGRPVSDLNRALAWTDDGG